jgi:hypothetical protein
MSAIEHPADRSGRITATCSGVSMSAVSAMKCTPQKITYLASCSATFFAASCESFSESPVKSACRMTSSVW